MEKEFKCCIVIPVYKSEITKEELASLKQVLKVLPNYAFFFVCFKDLDTNVYLNVLKTYPNISYRFEFFYKKYFESIEGYNKLLITPDFYRRFASYEYMLIYQLDAWVFFDELKFWCNKSYDYIGAPWFGNFGASKESDLFLGVGNGGFSLRKISSQLKVLNSFTYIKPFKNVIGEYLDKVNYHSTKLLFRNLVTSNNTFFLLNNDKLQEDFFWGFFVSKRIPWYKVPDPEEAFQFAMEVNGPLLFRMNGNKLPFGCHAWEKYDKVFWEQYILID